MRQSVLVLALVFLPVVNTTSVGAVTGINEYTIPTSSPGSVHIALGADNNLWFTEYSADKIGKVTSSGVITEYTLPTSGARPWGITAGPDGNLWFTENLGNAVGKITPSGVVTEYPLGTNTSPSDITTGPDGNLWITSVGGNSIVKMNTSGNLLASYPLTGVPKNPTGIVAGPDGNLWFTENLGNAVGKITPSGVVTEYPLPHGGSGAWGITVGPDNKLWFTETGGNRLGTLTTTGVLTEYSLAAGSGPWGLVTGPDGNLWVTLNGSNKIGVVTTAGTQVQSYDIPTASSVAAGITKDATNKIWFMEWTGKIGEVTNIAIPPYDDHDGISEAEEAAAPNGGDANNDGLPDSHQPYVASFMDPQTGKYVTIEVASVCQLANVAKASVAVSTGDTAYSYPYGMISFSAACGTNGYTTPVKVYSYDVQLSSGLLLRNYSPSTHVYETIAGAQLSQSTIGGESAVLATYSVTDGGVLDEDGVVNGTIVDPVGLAVASAGVTTTNSSTPGTLANTGSNTSLSIVFGSSLLIAGILVLIARRML